MAKSFYKVVFEGDLLPGHSQEEVQKKLAALLKLDKATASGLFAGKTLTMKNKLDLPQAKKYALALAKFGVMGYIVQDTAEPTESTSKAPTSGKEPSNTGFTVNSTVDIAAVKAYFEGFDVTQEKTREENVTHEIFSLDNFDEEVANMHKEDVELTGTHDVLSAEQIKELLKKK